MDYGTGFECAGFEFSYNVTATRALNTCVLSSSADTAGCDGVVNQLDFYERVASTSYNFKGCYADSSDRDLPVQVGTGLTHYECHKTCQAQGYGKTSETVYLICPLVTRQDAIHSYNQSFCASLQTTLECSPMGIAAVVIRTGSMGPQLVSMSVLHMLPSLVDGSIVSMMLMHPLSTCTTWLWRMEPLLLSHLLVMVV